MLTPGRCYETISCFRSSNMGLTLYDKLWDSHVVHLEDDGTALLYIDRHLVHEVTSPQAYEGLKVAGRKPWRVDSVVATADHNTPTTGWDEGVEGIRDPFAKLQIQTLDANIRRTGKAGGTGHAIEFAGSTIRALSMEGRMTICNMSIEAGARAGMVAADETTIEYVKGRPLAPKGAEQERAASYWRTLKSDPDAKFDREVALDARAIKPHVTWGTSPEMVITVDDAVPDPEREKDGAKRDGMERALAYMGLKPRTRITDVKLDKIFIGSCTNSRIEDLRAAAAVVQGRRVASNVRLALVVPGSGLVKAQAEREGLDRVFRDAGFEWREPGCSMCLGMNPDRLDPGERCASTSNRNFEGRQGAGGRTHLVSPAMAAAAAIAGHFVDVRQWR